MKRIAVVFALIGVIAVLIPSAAPTASAPAAPTGASGISLDGKVVLAWQPVAGATGYTVYRGTSPTSITTRLTSATGITATNFADTTAINGTTYYYVARSVAAGVESSDSLQVQAKAVARACSTGNAVVLENCYPGNNTWKVVNPSTGTGGVEGFATAQSVNRGGSVDLKINADDGASVRIEVYRNGYYGGNGGRLFSTIRNVPTVRQPGCLTEDTTGLVDCSNWSTTATLTTTSDWPAGVYLLRIVRQDTSADAHILLVVRDDASTSPLLYGVSFSTFEAYNNYGGRSLYDFNSFGSNTVAGTPRAVKVSFDRPFTQVQTGQRDWYPNDEYATVYWLEQSGYDVSYVSNTDLDQNPTLVTRHKTYISPSHDEYWSAGMRSALKTARDAGTNLWFSGSNEIYWKVRFENGPTGRPDRLQVCYKSTQSGGADPSGIPTGTWRDPAGANQPENALTGQMYIGDADNTYFPLVVSATQGQDRLYRYTGLDTQTPGSSSSVGTTIVGWEWDARVANGQEPAGVKTLAGSPVTGNLIQHNGKDSIPGSATSNITKYTAPSGALVVNQGTNQWNRGLARSATNVGEPNTTIQQFTTNVLADMGALPQTPAGDITLDVAANRPPAPTNVGAVATGTDTVQITWNAVAGASGYNVYRAIAPREGGQPLGSQVNGAPLTGTSFTDTGLASATPYYYVVTDLVGGVQSLASTEAVATTSASAGQATRIDAGSTSDTTTTTGALFRADTFYTGGSTNSITQTVTGTTDPALYQTERWGNFAYNVPVANGTYTVRLHFAELYYGTSVAGGNGKRVFSIDIGNTAANPDVPNIDPYAQAPGARVALIKTVNNVVVTNGTLNIHSVYGAADDPEITAFEIVPVSVPPSVTDTFPADTATGQSRLTHPTATFSRAMDATTITSSSFTLTPAGGSPVAATVAYNSGTGVATLTPTSSLAYSTTYTARLTTAVKGADGVALQAPVTWSFTTQAAVPPTVTSQFPGAGSTGVSQTAAIRAAFSRSLDPTTINSSSFTITGPSGPALPAVVTYDDPSRTATLQPSSPLAVSTTYTISLSTAIKATDGVAMTAPVSWTVTTAATPPPPPSLASSNPAANATGVATSTTVDATFSRAMYGASIDATTFTLSGPHGNVASTVTYDPATLTARLTPNSPLDASSTYTAKLESTIDAADGTLLGTDLSWSFTTILPPTVTSTTPAAGAGFFPRSGSATATFSRAMDPSSLNSSTFTISGPSGQVPVTVTYDAASRTATATPSALLPGGSAVTASIGTGARAADGTQLASAVSWTFSTAACPCTFFSGSDTPAVTGLSTQDGRSGAGPWSLELGMRFTVDDPTRITALRFYKSDGEIGTHKGILWAVSAAGDTGTQLASVDFVGETASGWQQQALPSGGIVLNPGTTYEVGVNANAMFVVTQGGLASEIGSGAMRTVVGANGLYALQSGLFPSQTFASSNYYVDVEGSPNGDPVAPTATSLSPAAGSTGAPRSTAVQATFSRALTGSTVTSTSFTLRTNSGTVVPATVAYDAASRTATLTPNASLAYSTVYTAKLDTSILASDGMPLSAPIQWSFTTADPVPPTVTAIVPDAGATDVGTGIKPRATFSKSIKPASLTTSTFTLTGPSGAVAGTVSYDDPSKTATFTPTAALTAGATYTMRLDGSITATDDSTLATPYTWTFTVAAAVPPPTIASTNPTGGASAVSRSVKPTATFSRSMDPATLTASTFTLTGPAGAVAATVSYDSSSRTATLTPSATLAANASYTATITVGAKAADGTPLASAVSWSFTTAACPCNLFSPVLVPSITGLPTQDGRSGAGPWSYELGVKVTVTQAMQLNAVRFYKDASETGTHTARIWTSGGVQLASVTFTGETASGWQQQALAAPLSLQAGSVYVVSVNANSRFVVTPSGLATQVVSGPLRSVVGSNGVYGASAGTFPTGSYSNSNYFVDPVVAPVDVTPPTVTTAPTNGATGVPRNVVVAGTFSRSMDASTITSSTFTLTGPSGAVAGTVSYDDTSKTASFTPTASLAYSTNYTARFAATVRAADGVALAGAVSWTFTVANAVPPTVTGTLPVNGALDIGSAVRPRATFSKSLKPATVTTSTMTLTGPSGAVSGSVAYDDTTKSATFTPTAALASGTYTVRLDPSITATDDATLATAYTWTFTVAASLPAPTVTSTSPSSGATNVARSTVVKATFNRSVDPATVTGTTFTLKAPDGSTVPATVSYDGATLTAQLVPSALLAATTQYTASLTSGVKAADGSSLTAVSWNFTTTACPCSLFGAAYTPASTGNPTQDGRNGAGPWSYELGVKITVDNPLQLTAVRFYKDAAETGTHVARIWAPDGTQLGSVTFTGETASGWQQQALSTPVALQAGVTYTVSVNANAFFVATGARFAAAVGSGPLHAVVGPNGVYGASAGIFPTGSWNSSDYGIDVVVQ